MLVLVNRVMTDTYEDRPGENGSLGPGRQKYVYAFTAADFIQIAGAVHGLGTEDLGVFVYERLPTALHAVTAEVHIDLLTYDVLITLLQPMTGQVVLFA